jgi:ribose transport system substrate-binding protein
VIRRQALETTTNIMLMKTMSFLAAGLAAALLLGAGCDQEPSTSTQSHPANHVIAVIPKSTNLVFWQSVVAGAREAGKDYGYQIDWNGPDRETNSAGQIQIIDDAIAHQVEGVVLAPVDRRELVPAVEKLAALKIPCAIIDSGLDSVQFLSFASTDNYQGGVLAAQRMGRMLGGKGRVLVVRHIAGSHSTAKRVSGFTETISNSFPGITIADSQSGGDTVEGARQATAAMLAQHPDAQGVFACNITTSVGALQALQAANLPGVKLVAFDPDKTLLDGLRVGQVDAIILQNPYQMGYEGVKVVALHNNGQSSPRLINTGIEMVTSETLTDPKIMRLLGLQQ